MIEVPVADPDIWRHQGSVLISGALVLDPRGELHRPAAQDILIEDKVIVAIGDEARSRGQVARTFDARGLIVTPGFVNAHCHSHDTLLRGLFEQMTLETWGTVAFPFHWPPRPTEEIAVRTRAHAVECLVNGITTIQDMVTIVDFEPDHAAAVAGAYSEAGIEALVAPQYSDLAGRAGVPFAEDCFAADEIDLLGDRSDFRPIVEKLTSIFANISAPGVSWALGPVQPQICSDEFLQWTARYAAETGMRLYMHLYETRAEAVLARRTLASEMGSAVRRLARLGVATPHLTIAHGVWITGREIDELAQEGIGLAANPVTNLKLMNGFAPIRRYHDAGVVTGLGCDNSSASDAQNIFQAMKAFALLWAMQSPAGEETAAAAAFRAATTGGAKLLGLEGKVGRIAPGYRANLTFIDATGPAWRPLNSAIRQLVYGETGRGVIHVMAAGRFVVMDGKCRTVDEASLCRDIDRIREAMEIDLAGVRIAAGMLTKSYAAVAARVAAEPLEFDARLLVPPI
jgi:cytosine/adenosine deaminase-related metal-dependent hydrolase